MAPLTGGRIHIDGNDYLNLSSNNYLGLAETLEPLQATDAQFFGATAARLISGNHPSFSVLERTLADLKGTESSLVFSCGYLANLGIITAVAGRGDAVFSDRLNHASIVDGIRLSGAGHHRYRHNDMGHLEALLRKTRVSGTRFIITESLFSMDGDMAPLPEIAELKERYGAVLVVDEAHSGGVYGAAGAGLVNELGLTGEVDIQMGTFSKAYGSYGAYAAAKKCVIDHLVNRSRSFIYTTGLPPILNAANIQALRLARTADDRRQRVHANADLFRSGLTAAGLDIGNSCSYIVPWITSDSQLTVAVSSKLRDARLAALPIRPPTVPPAASRIRFSITAAHDPAELREAVSVIAAVAAECGAAAPAPERGLLI